MSDVFDATPNPQPEGNPLEILVGEGKKYKTVEDLALAYMNADTHILELREDLVKTKTRAETFEALINAPKAPEPVTPPTPNPDPKAVEAPAPSDDDLKARIKEVALSLTEEEKRTANINTTAEVVVRVFGGTAEANAAVVRRANELGVSVEWLKSTAASSPNAFYAAMGIQPDAVPQNRETPAPKNDVVLPPTGHTGQAKAGTYAYYDAIRKADKTRYYSPALQREMMESAKKLGPDFYKR